VTSEEFRAEVWPSAEVVPNKTCELEALSVVQVMVALVAATDEEVTELMTGGVPTVVNE
jgi:hypothetical protein